MDGALRGGAGLLALLLVLSAVVPGAALAAPPSADHVGTSPRVATSDRAAAAQTDDVIRQTQTYALRPNTTGQVAVTLTYDIPDRVHSLKTDVPAAAAVQSTDGFAPANGTTFRWDGETDAATIEYRVNPNRTVEREGPFATDGRYVAADAGDWALFSRSQTPTRWTYSGNDPVRFERSVTTAGPGAAGDTLVYLGETTTYERTASGQQFTLAVPAESSLTESPDEILTSLSTAAAALRVGERDEDVFVVAAPTTSVDWAVRGLETGGSDMWVADDEHLDSADNVWIHEYVHTRQSFRETRETRWFTEASAVYFAAALTLEQDRIDYESFAERLDDGERAVYDDAVLTEPATWEQNANYYRGPLVAGRIDEQIRRASDRKRTLQDTLRILNVLDGPVTQSAFLGAVGRPGDPKARTIAQNLTATSEPVTMWNRSLHLRVFGPLPAGIGYALPRSDGPADYVVNSTYRNATVPAGDPLYLAVNETLTVETLVSNVGGTAGTYNATLAVNGTVADRRRGELAADSETVVPLAYTFTDPGRYDVRVGGENVTVLVSQPASAMVTGVTVSDTSVTQGDTVVVTATVTNDERVPGTATVRFTRDGDTVSEQVVSLPPESTLSVTGSVMLQRPGSVHVSAGAAVPVEVRVTPNASTSRTTAATVTPSNAPALGVGGTGFTAGLAVLAMLGATVLLTWRFADR